MDWRQYIHSDPKILLGKLTVKGTRLSVEFILGLFANGWTKQQVLENYPALTRESVQAVFVFVAVCKMNLCICYRFYLSQPDAIFSQRKFSCDEL